MGQLAARDWSGGCSTSCVGGSGWDQGAIQTLRWWVLLIVGSSVELPKKPKRGGETLRIMHTTATRPLRNAALVSLSRLWVLMERLRSSSCRLRRSVDTSLEARSCRDVV